MLQRVVPVLLFFLVVFGGGVMLGLQAAPQQASIALGLGGSVLLPVVMAYWVAGRRVVASHRSGSG